MSSRGAAGGQARARLEWTGLGPVPPEVQERLIGPGAPYELVTEDVRGVPMKVFRARPRTLRAMFDTTVDATPDRDFLVAGERRWTFAEARRDIDALGRLLVERYGIGRGDRVAIVAANSPEYGLAMWAVVSIGAIVTSLNGWWTGPELAYGIELTTPGLVLGDEPRLGRLRDGDVPAGVPVLTLEDVHAEAVAAPGGGTPVADLDEDTPAVILFTSGTTGRPKGAVLSHRNIVNFALTGKLASALGQLFTPAAGASQPATILGSPMFHVSGMVAILMTGGALGSKLVFAPPGRWDPGVHLRLTREHRISTWAGVPAQFWRLLRHPDFDPDDLTCVVHVGGGGAPFPPELVRALTEKMPWVTLGNGYGMSETVGLGTRIGGPTMVAHPDSVGAAYPTMEVEIRDPMGETVAEGEVGEIHLRSPSVFLGYWDNPKATEAAIDPGGWYRTGDFGRIEGGMLYLESRMRDLIIRGGENIYPMEIEHRLVEHPDIDDAAVIGVDHPELGQEVKAVLVLRPGAELTVPEVRAWCAETLAAFKVPAHVEFRAALPYTETGKVLKHELEHAERQRGAPAAPS